MKTNKIVVTAHIAILAACVTSHLFVKKMERDIRKATKQMELDRIKLQNDIANLGK